MSPARGFPIARVCLLLVFISFLAASSASAQQVNVTWIGGTSNWNFPQYWSPYGIPNNSGVRTYNVSFSATNDYVLSQATQVTVNNITLAPTTWLVLGTNGNLSLVSGVSSNSGTLRNTSTSTLTTGAASTLRNYATLLNEGTLNNGFALINESGAAFSNSGLLVNGPSGSVQKSISNLGTLTNSGTILNQSLLSNSGALSSSNTLTNSGTLTNEVGATLTNSSKLHNQGLFTNSGTLSNSADLTNELGATLDNSGTIQNALYSSAKLNNYGTLNNSGTLDALGISVNNFGTLNNSGTLAVTMWGALYNNAGATLVNSATLTSTGVSFIENRGQLTNLSSGAILNNGSYVKNYGTLDNQGLIDNGSTVENYGTLSNSGSIQNGDLYNWGLLNNSGAIQANRLFNYAGVVHNSDTIQLNGLYNSGQISNTGTMSTAGSGMNYSWGTISNDGSLNFTGGTFYNDGTLLNTRTLNNSALLQNSATLQSTGTFTSTGTLYNTSTGTMDLAQMTVAGGVLRNDGAINMTAGNPLEILAAGTLTGSGAINGNVLMGGILNPGNSPGTLTINGNYMQTSGGAFTAEIGGLFAGTQHDQLVVNGDVTLDGILQLAFLNQFFPQLGDSFALLLFSGVRTGSFGALNWSGLPPGFGFQLIYGAHSISVAVNQTPSATPEPSSLLLLGTGLSGAAFYWRRLRSRRTLHR